MKTKLKLIMFVMVCMLVACNSNTNQEESNETTDDQGVIFPSDYSNCAGSGEGYVCLKIVEDEVHFFSGMDENKLEFRPEYTIDVEKGTVFAEVSFDGGTVEDIMYYDIEMCTKDGNCMTQRVELKDKLY